MRVRILRLALLWLLAAVLSACETAYKDGAPNERSPWFFVPIGSKLVLHRSIEVPPEQASAYLQAGRLLAWYHVNQYAPYCAVTLQPREGGARLLHPDDFTVRGVTQRPLSTLAAAAMPRQVSKRDHDGMTYEVLATTLDIHSARQPEVRSMTCASWCLPQGRLCNTVEDVRRALGAYITLELAAPGRKP